MRTGVASVCDSGRMSCMIVRNTLRQRVQQGGQCGWHMATNGMSLWKSWRVRRETAVIQDCEAEDEAQSRCKRHKLCEG